MTEGLAQCTGTRPIPSSSFRGYVSRSSEVTSGVRIKAQQRHQVLRTLPTLPLRTVTPLAAHGFLVTSLRKTTRTGVESELEHAVAPAGGGTTADRTPRGGLTAQPIVG